MTARELSDWELAFELLYWQAQRPDGTPRARGAAQKRKLAELLAEQDRRNKKEES